MLNLKVHQKNLLVIEHFKLIEPESLFRFFNLKNYIKLKDEKLLLDLDETLIHTT